MSRLATINGEDNILDSKHPESTEKLKISNKPNDLTNEEVELICKMKKLEVLELCSTNITSDTLSKFPSDLRALGLYNCPEISDKGILHFINLTDINITECNGFTPNIIDFINTRLYKRIHNSKNLEQIANVSRPTCGW
jgi:hypothetical protein